MPYELLDEPQGRYELLPPQTSFMDDVKQGAGNMLAGAVRGAGSIGATLVDAARSTLGDQTLSAVPSAMRPNVTAGLAEAPRGDQLRTQMDAGLQSMGAEPDSFLYKTGKLGGEIAGTAGAGGVLANGARALGATRSFTGLEPIVNGVVRGLETGGFRVGELAGTGLGTAARLGTGAAVGGASAGLVNPADTGTGALIGGALPGATALAGRTGAFLRGGSQQATPEVMASARDAIGAGYTIPPATVNPTFMNKALESVSGKMATQQIASARNAEVSRDLVRKALGVGDDVALNRATLEGIRKEAGKAYRAIADLPAVPAQGGSSLTNTPQMAAIKPAKLIEDLKQARNDAQAWFKSYNASANPEHLAKARAADALSNQIEGTLEKYAVSRGASDLLPALREARKKIAQTYTVERALNEATGSIDATVLGRLYNKGKPLSDGLETVGRFGSAFPTVAKLPEKVGSPDTHNLRTVGSLMLGAIGGAGAGPAGLAAAAIPYLAPPVARSVMFSKPMQRGLLNIPGAVEEPLGLLTQGAYRGLPLLSAQ